MTLKIWESFVSISDVWGCKRASLLLRAIAKTLDFIIIAAAAEVIPRAGFFAGLAYLLIGDGLFDGRSFGKRSLGSGLSQQMLISPVRSEIRYSEIVFSELDTFFIRYPGLDGYS